MESVHAWIRAGALAPTEMPPCWVLVAQDQLAGGLYFLHWCTYVTHTRQGVRWASTPQIATHSGDHGQQVGGSETFETFIATCAIHY